MATQFAKPSVPFQNAVPLEKHASSKDRYLDSSVSPLEVLLRVSSYAVMLSSFLNSVQ